MSALFEVERLEKIRQIIDAPKPVLLLGESKCGKTVLLRQIYNYLTSRDKPAFLYQLASPQFDAVDAFENHFLEDLELHFKRLLRSRPKHRAGAIQSILDATRALDARGVSNKIFVLLDGIDRNYPDDQRGLLYDRLRYLIDFSTTYNPIFLVCSSTTRFFELEADMTGSGLNDRLFDIEVGALTPEESREMIGHCLRPIMKGARISEDVYDFCYIETGGHVAILSVLLIRTAEALRGSGGALDVKKQLRQMVVTLSDAGLPFFRTFIQTLGLEEITYLQALAQSVPIDGWNLENKKQLHLTASGLVDFSSRGIGRIRGRIFSAWLRRFTSQLFSRIPSFAFRIGTVEDLNSLLANTLRSCFGIVAPDSEKEVQVAVRGLLSGNALKFQEEGPRFEYRGKSYITDFYLPDLDLALEVKLVKTHSRFTDLLEEIAIDVDAYASNFRRAIFLVYDLTASAKNRLPVALEYGMFVETVVVEH
jgi:hypothetical protein